MKKKPFSQLLIEHIVNNYKDETFSSVILEEFGKKHGKTRSSISQILLELERQEKLEIVNRVNDKTSTHKIKIYKVAEGADLSVISLKNRAIEWHKQQAIKEKRLNEACLRLNKVLDIMTANR